MTLRMRNRLLKIVFAAGLFLPLLSVFNFVFFLTNRSHYDYRFADFPDFFSIAAFYVFLLVLTFLIYGLIGLTYYRFRAIMSNEIFFHILSLFVLLFVHLKTFFLNYPLLNGPDFFFVSGMKIFYAVILLVPLYSFCGAFFSLGIENNRFDVIFYVLLVGFAFLSVLIPIDSATVGKELYYRSYVLLYICLLFILLELLTAVIYLTDRKVNTLKDNFLLMISEVVFSFLFLAIYAVNKLPVLAVLTVFYFAAYSFYAKKLYKIYLWR